MRAFGANARRLLKLAKLAGEHAALHCQAGDPCNDWKCMAIVGTEPAMVAEDQIASADRRDEGRICVSDTRFALVNDDKCSLVQRIDIEAPPLDARRRIPEPSQRIEEATGISKPFHANAGVRCCIFVARLDHNEMATSHTKKLLQDQVFISVIRLDC